MRNFRELKVWTDGRTLVKDIYTLTKLLPDSERFGLVPQIQRSAIPYLPISQRVAANIHKKILCAFYKSV